MEIDGSYFLCFWNHACLLLHFTTVVYWSQPAYLAYPRLKNRTLPICQSKLHGQSQDLQQLIQWGRFGRKCCSSDLSFTLSYYDQPGFSVPGSPKYLRLFSTQWDGWSVWWLSCFLLNHPSTEYCLWCICSGCCTIYADEATSRTQLAAFRSPCLGIWLAVSYSRMKTPSGNPCCFPALNKQLRQMHFWKHQRGNGPELHPSIFPP